MHRIWRRSIIGFAVVMLLVAAVGTAAASVGTNVRFLDVDQKFNTCNGELVEVSGMFHIVTQEQPDGTAIFQLNAHLTGEGDQGNSYVVNIAQRNINTTDTSSFRVRETLISRGAAPNQQLIVAITNPPGDVDFIIECQG